MTRILGTVLVSALCLSACDTKVQQVQPPRVADAPGPSESHRAADMMAEPEVGPKPVLASKLEKKAHCCAQCVAALDKDRSGQDATKIPCMDFTADMEEDCVIWFRSNPVKASDAASCADAAKKKIEAKAKSDS
jgi:hypothetical protein